jgi:hypothetical protein
MEAHTMLASKRKSPEAAPHSFEALQNKVQLQYSTWIVREIIATLTTGALFAVITWSAILGMSGNMGPGNGVVVGPVAEASGHE